jgi:hypothetical protein
MLGHAVIGNLPSPQVFPRSNLALCNFGHRFGGQPDAGMLILKPSHAAAPV